MHPEAQQFDCTALQERASRKFRVGLRPDGIARQARVEVGEDHVAHRHHVDVADEEQITELFWTELTQMLRAGGSVIELCWSGRILSS